MSRQENISKVRGWRAVFAAVLFGVALNSTAQTRKTQNVVIVMTDGFRWQELFRGADPAMFNDQKYTAQQAEKLRKRYLAGTPEENRALLMPFFWGTIAKQGQVFGDRDAGSNVVLKNGLKFSYPGYNETLTGRPNPAINTNDFPDNPNATVLEWLNDQSDFHGKLAAFAMWERFAEILRRDKSRLPVNVAYEPLILSPMTQELTTLNAVKTSLPRIFGDDESLDAPMFYQALIYLRQVKPRVLFISCGETDVWAHRGDYAEYLAAAHRYDGYLRTLWDTLQSMPEYRDSTTLVLATDHGRGTGKEWKGHGPEIEGAEDIWTAYFGPDTAPLGVRANIPQVTQGQLAPTVAALLGKNFEATNTDIAPVIRDVLSK